MYAMLSPCLKYFIPQLERTIMQLTNYAISGIWFLAVSYTLNPPKFTSNAAKYPPIFLISDYLPPPVVLIIAAYTSNTVGWYTWVNKLRTINV